MKGKEGQMRAAASENLYLGDSAGSGAWRPVTNRRIADLQPRLRMGLVATFGPDLGEDASSEAIAWALSHGERVAEFANPAGYLYRVGKSWALRQLREQPTLADHHFAHVDTIPDIDLHRALQSLTEPQRTCVLLVHACGWSYQEVASLLHRSESSVRNHLHRGLEALRAIVPARETYSPSEGGK
jgi:RNA polymerase sigma factor (sigma-70 family)